ncbi:MAG TPA: YihY/virulence factor BrkB family protein [Chloroflexota bacterium]
MGFKTILTKLMKDNLGTLASIVSWSVMTSLVPITVGLIAISGFVLRNNPSAQQSVINHLSQALQGVITPTDLHKLVNATIQHSGLLGIIGLLGILWGGSSVGGAISTVFQAIFEVRGRNFVVEKLIDIGMIFVFTFLMLVIILGTTAGALVQRLFSNLSLPGVVPFIIGTAVSLLAAFLLFATIYTVFPNVTPRFKLGNVWKGAFVAAILFQILSYIWPLYAHFAHFQKDGALLGSIILLMAWVYFFSITMLIGAEVVAINALHTANQEAESIGPPPDGGVPQHTVLRDDAASASPAEEEARASG